MALTSVDISYIHSYVRAVWGDSMKVEIQNMLEEDDEPEVLLGGTFQIWKEGDVYKTGAWVSHGGSYWEPPDSDLSEFEDDSGTNLHDVLRALFVHIIDDAMCNVAEGIWAETEYHEQCAEEVLDA